MNIAIIGGDGRQAYLAELFAADGHNVKTYGLDGAGLKNAQSLADTMKSARAAVLPLPLTRDGINITAPLTKETIPLTDVLTAAEKGTLILAGKAGNALESTEWELEWEDYFLREEFTVMNAEVTAEGTLEILLRTLPVTLLGSRILVVGFGRIGKILARMLKALGADVTVSVRKKSDIAWIKAMGATPARTGKFENVGGFDAVVNTVPQKVLDRIFLAKLKKGCPVIELASAPGGIDRSAAEEMGVEIIDAPGLPGKTAPVTAAVILRDTIYNIIEEQECSR